jgi:hypothetical protein
MIKDIVKFIIKLIRYTISIAIFILGIYSLIISNRKNLVELFIFSIICFIFSIIFLIPDIKQKLRKIKQQKEYLKLIEQLKPYVETIIFKKPLPTIQPTIFLKDNEEAYIEEDSTFSQSKTYTVRYGGAVRITRGVYIGGTVPKYNSVITPIDHGKLILTNKRIVFNGEHTTKTIELDKIVAVDIYKDCFSISLEGKEKEFIFSTKQPWLWKVLIYYLKTGQLLPELKIETIQ